MNKSQCGQEQNEFLLNWRNVTIIGDIYIFLTILIVIFTVHIFIILIHNSRISRELWMYSIPSSDGDFRNQNLIMKVTSNKYYELIAGKNRENIAIIAMIDKVETGVPLQVNLYRSAWLNGNYKAPVCCMGFWHSVGTILAIYCIYMLFFLDICI